MATHGDHVALVDYEDRSSCSAENANRTTSFESQPPLQRAGANGMSIDETTSCHSGEISATNRVVVNVPILQYVDKVMGNLCNRAYLVPKWTSRLTRTATIEDSDPREAGNVNTKPELTLVLQQTANHMALTRSQSAELQCQQKQ